VKIFILFFFFLTSSAYATENVAVVKLIKGEVKLLTLGKTELLALDNWVKNGSVVKTGERSFVKLVFLDKSQINIGPNSQLKIERVSGKDAGVIDLVKGQIRSQVTKDYLQIKEREKSKLFIKTPNSVLGVRGTDFMLSTNGKNSSVVLFEGEIAFNRLDLSSQKTPSQLEEIVEKGVRLFPGEFSVMERNRTMPTVPALLNVQQKEKLEKNIDLSKNRTPANNQTAIKSVVPEGLKGQTVANESETLKKELKIVSPSKNQKEREASSVNPDAYVNGDKIKPANGSMLDVETGAIIPPGANAILDEYSNTYLPNGELGSVALDGSFVPNEQTVITQDGRVLVTQTTMDGVQTVEASYIPSSNSTSPGLNSGTNIQAPLSGGLVPNAPENYLNNGSPGSRTTVIIND
jgi:hypothetical protein